MSTGLQGEVEDIKEDEAIRAPLTRILVFIGRQIYRLYKGWRPLQADS